MMRTTGPNGWAIWTGLAWASLAVAAWAGCPQPAPVPPSQEIEILDPGVDPRGIAAIIPMHRADGLTRIGVPPTVLVHRYYYTGDRTFQGPMLTGGPCVVVVSHPRTGEQLYLPVQMLPGAPRVIYKSNSIEYDYGARGITIEFCLLSCQPKVVYRTGTPVLREVKNAADKVNDCCKSLIQRTSLPEYAEKACATTKNMTETAVDNASALCGAVTAPVIQVFQLLPGAKWATSSDQQRANVKQGSIIQAATERANSQETVFIQRGP